jgi:hypothetical protein
MELVSRVSTGPASVEQKLINEVAPTAMATERARSITSGFATIQSLHLTRDKRLSKLAPLYFLENVPLLGSG